MTTTVELPKKLDWKRIDIHEAKVGFDCPKCLQNNSLGIPAFKTENQEDSDTFQLTQRKFGYTSKPRVWLLNIVAFLLAVLVLLTLFGDSWQASRGARSLYTFIGFVIFVGLQRVLNPFFRKTMPIWRLKCTHCSHWIYLASDGIEEVFLAREKSIAKSTGSSAKGQQETSANPYEAALWDLKNGDDKTRKAAARVLVNTRYPDAVKTILAQAMKEKEEPESSSFLSSSVKRDFFNTLLLNSSKIRTMKSVDAYIDALSSGDKDVTNHAIHMLKVLGSPKAIEPLEKLKNGGYSGGMREGALEKVINRIKQKNGIAIQ